MRGTSSVVNTPLRIEREDERRDPGRTQELMPSRSSRCVRVAHMGLDRSDVEKQQDVF